MQPLKMVALALSLSGLMNATREVIAAETAPPTRAEIVYLYRLNPKQGGSNKGQQTIQGLFQQLAEKNTSELVGAYRKSSEPDDYVLVLINDDPNEIRLSGWTTQFLGRYDEFFPSARAFVLDSTLLLGRPRLNADRSSLIRVEHVDSDPRKRENIPPLFPKLEETLRRQPGFKDLQVWTWNERQNHWTVIEVWDSLAASDQAEASPEVRRLWDDIYGNAAAPNSVSNYRLLMP